MMPTDTREEQRSSAGATNDDTTNSGLGPGVNLRAKVLRGGAFLAVRQVIGMAITLIGVLMVTRVIGPREYGLYAIAIGIANFMSLVGPWGLDVYLLRKAQKTNEREFDQCFTLLLGISTLFLMGLLVLSGVISSFLQIRGSAGLIVFLGAAVPLNLLALPAIVKLDRDLHFKQVSLNELAGQVSMYAVAIPCAFAGFGAWAPASGYVTQQLVLMVLSYRSAGYRPSLYWENTLALKMLRYGLAYSSSTWLWQLRTLVNPLIVGRYAGAEAVGYVAISIRFAEVLSFAKNATWRIAMAALARISNDPAKLRVSIAEGMRLQAVAVGFPLAIFALAAPLLIPLGLGHNWAPALTVFPFIALGYLANAMFNLHISVLYLRGKNLSVAIFHTAHIVLFAGSAAFLIPHFGFRGYGWAEIVALLSYFVIHGYHAREAGSPPYLAAAIWCSAAVCALAISRWGTPMAYIGPLVLLTPLLFRNERKHMIGYTQLLFSRAHT